MKTVLTGIRNILLFSLVCCITFLGFPVKANAINLESSPYIMLESYEISNEKIVPGEDFTLTLTLKNYSVSATAKNVLVDISNPAGIAPVYGTVSQTWVEEMGPGETATVSFDYTSSVDITGDYLDFYITMVGEVTNYITLRAPVGSDSPFSVLAVSIPEQLGVNSISSASVSFRVLGDENVRNVAMEFILNGESVSKSSIGILTAGTTRTQSISVTGFAPGQFNAELILYYDDETDQTQSVVVGSAIVDVINDIETDVVQEETTEIVDANDDSRSDDIVLLGVGGILILGIFTVVLLIARKKK